MNVTIAWVVMMFNAHHATVQVYGHTKFATREQCEAVRSMIDVPRKVPHKYFCAEVVIPNILINRH